MIQHGFQNVRTIAKTISKCSWLKIQLLNIFLSPKYILKRPNYIILFGKDIVIFYLLKNHIIIYNYIYLEFLDRNIFNKLGVIKPDDKLKMIFDFVIIILIVFLFFLFPLQMSLDFYLIEQLFPTNIFAQKFIYFLIVTLFLTDIVLKFFTGFYENGVSVIQRDKVFKNYLQNHLIFDIISFLPVFLLCFKIPN